MSQEVVPPRRVLPRRLGQLEAEGIGIIREVAAAFRNPVLLYSAGKDSTVVLHLALKAFFPGRPPFPLLHIATGWDFRAVLEFRDEQVRRHGLRLIVHSNPEGIARGINPIASGSALHMQVNATEALRQALGAHGFDCAIGGARRDEERSRAKERVFSHRDASQGWDPRQQRPEPWELFNTRLGPGESMRAFPLSNWTEADVWDYILHQGIPVVPLYLAAPRPMLRRGGVLIMADDERLPLSPGEVPETLWVRFRTMGCYPLTAAMPSRAATVEAVIAENRALRESERAGRLIDSDSPASMERKKREGYF